MLLSGDIYHACCCLEKFTYHVVVYMRRLTVLLSEEAHCVVVRGGSLVYSVLV